MSDPRFGKFIEAIEKEKKLDDAMEEKIKALVEEYKGLFQA